MRIDHNPDRLLERQSELRAIETFIASGVSDPAGALVIRGPAGIGKTRLLRVVGERAEASGMTVLAATAAELERDLAWGVVRQLFEPVVRRLRASHEIELTGASRLALPVLGLGHEQPGPDSLSSALHGLYWLAADLGERHPVLLAVDDLQWADPASTRFLQYLSNRLADMPVLLAVAVRTGEQRAAGRPRSLGEAARELLLEPRPLSIDASQHLLTAAMHRAPEEEFLAAYHGATGGNPFLLTELALQLATDGVEPVASHASRVGQMTPQSITNSVVQRLASVPDRAQAVAKAVAVLGGAAALVDAAALSGLSEPEAAAGADALSAAELLRPGTPLEFVHPVVAAAVYSAIPPLARQAAHQRAARLLADAHDDAAAGHIVRCEPRGDQWAVDILLAAAASARNRGAPEESITYLRRALAEPPASDRAAVLFALGAVEAEAHGPAGLDHLRQAAAAARDPALRGAVALTLVGVLNLADGHAEGFERARESWRELQNADAELALQLQAATIAMSWYVAGVAGRHGVPIARRAGVPAATLGERLMLVALAADSVFAATERAECAVRLIARALARGSLVEELGPEALAFWQAMYLLHAADAFDVSTPHESAAFELARRRGSATSLSMAATYRAHADLQQGRLRDAEAELDQARRLSPPWPFFRYIVSHISLETDVARGQLAEADRRAADLGPFPEETLSLNALFALCSRGRLRLAQGRTREALSDLERVGRDSTTRNPAVYPWRSSAALALAALGRRQEAWARVEEELELARAFGAARPIGVALRTMGALAGPREGVTLLRDSADVLQACPSPLERARSWLELGSALRRAGKRAEALPLLRDAVGAAEACAAMPVAERARRELLDAGARPRRPARSSRDTLTPSELRVAQFASDGMANKEIAQALFVSLRTVETHLTHAYSKLGISSRRELDAALARQGATDLDPMARHGRHRR